MSAIGKFITAVLGVLALLACIATVGIIGYSLSGNNAKNYEKIEEPTPLLEMTLVSNDTNAVSEPMSDTNNNQDVQTENTNSSETDNSTGEASKVPETTPTVNPNDITGYIPVANYDASHIHDYKPEVIKKATCQESGQTRFVCACGDSYTVDTLATGHVPNDEWVVLQEATTESAGQRVRKCLYCGEIVASETIPKLTTSGSSSNSEHEHLYVATTEREATCTLAGLRRHTCACGDFYTESVPAVGHVGGKWKTTSESTISTAGSSEVRCEVCGALLDIKKLPLALPSLSPSPSPSASGSASPSTSPSPTPTPHSHSYTAYVVTPATCTEKGVRSYVCSCGDSYAESIELDANNHKYEPTFVAATDTQQGYTIYTCIRCNHSYKDNFTLPLTNQGNSSTSASPQASATNGTATGNNG